MTASVTYTGEEVAIVAALIAGRLPFLTGPDREIADLMLDKAVAGFPLRPSPELARLIAEKRGET